MNEMDVLPQLKPFLDQQLAFDLMKDLEEIRHMPAPPFECPDDIHIHEATIMCGDGERKVRIYKPVKGNEEIFPAVYWMHGGGYVLGRPEVDDRICTKIAQEVHCVVVSIDYRLAPEHPYPAGLEDAYSGLKWTWDQAQTLSIDRDRIAIAGPSAGGGLAAALALLVRDRQEMKLIFQMPLYPMIDDQIGTYSGQEFTKETMPKAWNMDNNIIAWDMYLRGVDRATMPYYAAPFRADDLTGLPPTYTCVGQLDPFRDETMKYVQRLAEAGIPVEFQLYPGCYHGFDALGDQTEISRKANETYIEVLKKVFDTIK